MPCIHPEHKRRHKNDVSTKSTGFKQVIIVHFLGTWMILVITHPHQIRDTVIPVRVSTVVVVDVLYPCPGDGSSVGLELGCPCDIWIRAGWQTLMGMFVVPDLL